MTLIASRIVDEGILVLGDKRVTDADGSILNDNAEKLRQAGDRVVGIWGRGDIGGKAIHVVLENELSEPVCKGVRLESIADGIMKRVQVVLEAERATHSCDGNCKLCTTELGFLMAGYEDGVAKRYIQIMEMPDMIPKGSYIGSHKWQANGATESDPEHPLLGTLP